MHTGVPCVTIFGSMPLVREMAVGSLGYSPLHAARCGSRSLTIVNPVLAIPVGSLPNKQMKEQISIAFIRMVAAAAGCSILRCSTDHDAVDISIKSSAEYGAVLNPLLDVQLKCTSQTDVVRKDEVAWQIDERTHKLLTSQKRSAPAILAVLVVPDDVDAWLDHDEARLLTESAMYWILGEDIPALPEGQQYLTVKIPRQQHLTRDSLLGIMDAIGEGRIGGLR